MARLAPNPCRCGTPLYFDDDGTYTSRCLACYLKDRDAYLARRKEVAEERRRLKLLRANAGPLPKRTADEIYWRDLMARIVSVAVRLGILQKLDGSSTCVDCGKQATCYDHRDYSKPIDVEPVCHPCNVKRGRGAMPEFRFRDESHDSSSQEQFPTAASVDPGASTVEPVNAGGAE